MLRGLLSRPSRLTRYTGRLSRDCQRGEGIRRAGLRPTHTSAVLITRGRINDQLGKIASLTPRDERRKAFRLLVAVLAIADGRRREHYCSDGCGHWWHRLSAAG
ncbi:DUF5958 family protein (plasmid) [Streptomyces sp. NBC_00984]|uniref:DUF5958 family protein n=1 Tax=Streptomyces sp. NBC_00984 TaxID=2903700 RepID=UPI002F90CA31|nr:DUF5958 family protein [Streptomyces sp. NBC_00984]